MEGIAKASVMRWFKKSSQKKDVKLSKVSETMKWFKRSGSTVEGVVDTEQAPLKKEIDVVPKTEFSASRQTLKNINSVLNAGESSGEPSRRNQGKIDNHSGCSNKFFCGNSAAVDKSTPSELTDNTIDESIKDHKNRKTTLIGSLRAADNNTHDAEGSSVNATETECRRPIKVNKHVKNVHFDSYFDDGIVESGEPCEKYVNAKIHCERCDLLQKSDKRMSAEIHKSTLNYRLLSNIEKQLDESLYNLRNCKTWNQAFKTYQKIIRTSTNIEWEAEDFNDDNLNTRMSDDTRAIKEFYRLSIKSHILVHFHDIKIETGAADLPHHKMKFKNFLNWLRLKGEEITEKRKIKGTSWLTTFLKFFRKKKHPRNKAEKCDPGEGVEAYTLALAQDESSIFAKNIYNFIACTRESREKIPHKVMRNIRQFMNGMKNYLVKHGEKDFGTEVDKARASLKHDEFLNLDQILEGVMHQLIILPLKEYLYELFVDYYGSRGDIELIISNMKFAESKDPEAFGVKKGLKTPPPQALSRISMLFAKLQEAELPFEKLDFLLTAMTMILDNTIDPESETNDVRHFGCDDFLPLLAYVLCKTGFHFAEIEAEYIFGLMIPTVMNGQSGYYTTSLCTAAISLKEFKQQYESPQGILPNNSLECSVLRIIIPNEYNGSIQTKTIPVRPHTTTRDVIRIISHKSQITNAMDYGLFKLIEGEETLLMDNDCPQDIRLASAGKHCTLVFRRFDSKIAWPKQ